MASEPQIERKQPNGDCPDADGWKLCIDRIKAYDKAEFKGWISDTDNLIIFAALFSAILTAFNIESYKLLKEDPVNLLYHISLQLGSFSVNNGLINSTIPSSGPFVAPAYAVRINAYWFSSLTCSMAFATISIIVRQWLREYSGWMERTSRTSIRIRGYRHARLNKWGIPIIQGLMPLLLLIAVGLFLLGLCEFVWALHQEVAIFVIILSATLGLFIFATALIPAFFPTSPYKTYHGWLIFNAWRRAKRCIFICREYFLPTISFPLSILSEVLHDPRSLTESFEWSSWVYRKWTESCSWMHTKWKKLFRSINHLRIRCSLPMERLFIRSFLWIGQKWIAHRRSYMSVPPPPYDPIIFRSWREPEISEVFRIRNKLDADILVWADKTFGSVDETFLTCIIKPCIENMQDTANCSVVKGSARPESPGLGSASRGLGFKNREPEPYPQARARLGLGLGSGPGSLYNIHNIHSARVQHNNNPPQTYSPIPPFHHPPSSRPRCSERLRPDS